MSNYDEIPLENNINFYLKFVGKMFYVTLHLEIVYFYWHPAYTHLYLKNLIYFISIKSLKSTKLDIFKQKLTILQLFLCNSKNINCKCLKHFVTTKIISYA